MAPLRSVSQLVVAGPEPNLPLPVPWATALLTLLLCKGTVFVAPQRPLEPWTPLPHPACPPIPGPVFTWPTLPSCACAHTRMCVLCLEMAASRFAPVGAGSTGLGDLPVPLLLSSMLRRHPHLPSWCSTLSGNRGCGANFNENFVSGSEASPSAPFLPQLFLWVLGPPLPPWSVCCRPPNALRKSPFSCFPRHSQKGWVHCLEGPLLVQLFSVNKGLS